MSHPHTHPLPPDVAQWLATCSNLFRKHGVMLAYLFGSHVQPKPRKPEDIDVAVLMDDLPHKLWGDLTIALRTNQLDIVHLPSAPAHFRFEVIRTGKLIYKENDEIENDFEMRTLAEYKDHAWYGPTHWSILRERRGSVQKWY